jgi:hypothetical protein
MAAKKILELDNGVPDSEEHNENKIRKSDRQRKIVEEYAEYFEDLHLGRLKSDLTKIDKEIEAIIYSLSCLDAKQNPAEVHTVFEELNRKWLGYQEIYSEYAEQITNTAELEQIGIRKRELNRKINDYHSSIMNSIRELASENTPVKPDDSRSVVSHVSSRSSSSSKRSSVSSKARAAARNAELARLKLEQALKKTDLKQKLLREQALMEKTRVELEIKIAETQLEEHLQDLRDQVECALYEAELLSKEEQLVPDPIDSLADEQRDHKRSLPKGGNPEAINPIAGVPRDALVPSVDNAAIVQSTPKQEQPLDVENYQLPFSTIQKNRPKTNVKQDNAQSYQVLSSSEGVSLADSLVQMSHQLVGVVKQNADATTVIRTMLQRQGIPKPIPTRFAGNPSQFPVFKNRIADWLDEKGFTDREKATHLLSFVDGEAREAIEHLETEENGFVEAMAILEERYGHPASVVKSCIKQITDGLRIERGDKQSLTRLETQLRTCLKALQHNKGYVHEMNASTNIERVIERLPTHMQIDWAKKAPKIRDETENGPDLRHVLSLVTKQLRVINDPQFGHIVTKTNASSSAIKLGGKTPVQSKVFPSFPRRNIATMVTDTDVKSRRSENESNCCPCCDGRHNLTKCEKFGKKLSPDERWNIVKDLKLCHICLTAGHMKAQCFSTERCHCKASFYHHELLHRNVPRREQQTPNPTAERRTQRKEQRSTETYATLTQERKRVVLLHVVPVRVISNEGNHVTTYGLLDNASRGTIISSELATALDIDGPLRPVTVTTVLGKQDCNFKEVKFKLQSVESTDCPILTVDEGIVKELDINEKVLPHEINHAIHPYLSDIDTPEVELKKVSLIIGQDVKRAHIVQEVRAPEEESQAELYATKTALGWTIAGTTRGREENSREVSVNFIDHDKLLRDRLSAFWSIENGGLDNQASTEKSASVEDRRAEKILNDTTKLVDGHYETGLLWKDDSTQLPNNRVIAEARLKSLKRKFQRDQDFEERYSNVVQDYINRGYARKLSHDEAETKGARTNYLPHHGVTNPNKPGKVRVVFDAAAKYDGTSLNQNLLQGPDMTNNLLGVLMRFRQGKTALVADIEGMFHQVKVSPEEQDSFRFLWWSGSLDEPPDEYVMTVHVFGATDSPCSSNYSLRRTAEDNRDKYDAIAIDTVLRHFYVDDMLRAVKNEEIAIQLANDLTTEKDLG